MVTQTTQQNRANPKPGRDAVAVAQKRAEQDVQKAQTGPLPVETPKVKLDVVRIKQGADVILQDAKRATSSFKALFNFILGFKEDFPADESDPIKREDYRSMIVVGTLEAAEHHACTIFERSLKVEEPTAKIETLRDIARRLGLQRLTYEQYKSRIIKAYTERFTLAKQMQEYYDWLVKNEGADQVTLSDGWLDMFSKRYEGPEGFDLWRRDANRTEQQLRAFEAKKARAERAAKKEAEQRKIDQNGAGTAVSGDKRDEIKIKSPTLQAAWNLMIQTFLDAVSGNDAAVEKREGWLVAILNNAVGEIKDKMSDERDAAQKPAFAMSDEDKADAAKSYMDALPDDPAGEPLTEEDEAIIEEIENEPQTLQDVVGE